MKTATAGSLIALSFVVTAAPALAQTELVLSSWLPPRHPIVVNAVEPWAEEIEEVTEGRVTVRVLRKPLGSPPAHFDMARDGGNGGAKVDHGSGVTVALRAA